MAAMMAEDIRISMPGTASTTGFVRTLIKRHIDEWGYADIADDALLIVAELLSNAIKATPGEPIKLVCRSEKTTLYVAVWDSSPERPVPALLIEPCLEDIDLSETAFDDSGGRGLHIIGALATEWGCHPDPAHPQIGHFPGKWVWARLHRPEIAEDPTPAGRR